MSAEQARRHPWMREGAKPMRKGPSANETAALQGLQAYSEANDLKKVALQARAPPPH